MTSDPFESASSLSLVDETALDTGDTDLIFTGEQLSGFEAHFLRRIASEASTDEINGKSTQLEIVEYCRCQRSLAEYERD